MSGSFSEPTVLWSTGHYIEGAEQVDECVDIVRQTVEICDHFQGNLCILI